MQEQDQDQYGTQEHEELLLAEEREQEHWSSYSYQDALSEIGKRETEGLATFEEIHGYQEQE